MIFARHVQERSLLLDSNKEDIGIIPIVDSSQINNRLHCYSV